MIQYYDRKEENNAKAIECLFDESQRLDSQIDLIHDFFAKRNYIFAGFYNKRVDVFKKYFGINCDRMTLGELAKEYGYTKENARIKIRSLLSSFKKDPYYTVMLNYTDEDLKGVDIKSIDDIRNLYDQLEVNRKCKEYEYYQGAGKQDFQAYTTLQKVLEKPCCEVECIRDIYSVDYKDGSIGSILNGENKNLTDKVAIRMLLHSRGLVFKDECFYENLWTEECIEGIKQYGIEKFEEDFEISGKSLFNKILSRPISTLGLSLMGQLVLNSDGIETIKDLITKTPRYIKLLRHMGDITYTDIKEKITSLGLGFRPMGMPENLWIDKLEHRFDLGITNKPENLEELLEFTNCEDVDDVYLFEIIDGDDFPSFFEGECRKANIVKIKDIANCTQEDVDMLIKSCKVMGKNKYSDKIDNILHKYGVELKSYTRATSKDLIKLKAEEVQKSLEIESQHTDVKDYMIYFDKVLNIDISELGLELRTYNTLARNGFRTLKDLVTRKKEDIVNISQFGKKRYFDLVEMLKNIEDTFCITLTLNDGEKHPDTHLHNLKDKYISKITLKVNKEKKNLDFDDSVRINTLPKNMRGLFAEKVGNEIKEEMTHTT